MARKAVATSLWALAFVAAGLWLLARLEAVVVPLLLGWFIAYVFDPVLDRLETWRVPRAVGIAILLMLVFVAAAVVALLVVPALVDQAREALRALPGYIEAAGAALRPRLESLLGGTSLLDTSGVVSAVAARLRDALPELGPRVAGLAGRMFANVWSLLQALLGLALIPVFAFYLLLDFNGLGERTVRWVPVRHQDRARRMLDRADEVLGAFVRGQLTVCAVLAVVYSVGLTFTGIDMPWVVGTLSGILLVVPYLGTVTGLVVASALALLKFHDLAHLLAVWGVFAFGQALESFLLTPRIVGDRVGLHPLAVIVAVLAGGELFGPVGVLLAVPGAAVVRVGVLELLETYRSSAFYRGEGG